jgi:hypothetical protein
MFVLLSLEMERVVLMRETAYKTRGKGEAAAEYGFGVQGGCVWVTLVCGYE